MVSQAGFYGGLMFLYTEKLFPGLSRVQWLRIIVLEGDVFSIMLGYLLPFFNRSQIPIFTTGLTGELQVGVKLRTTNGRNY